MAISVIVASPCAVGTQGNPQAGAGPYAIRATDQSGSVVGLIYSAETLSAFTASEARPVAPRVAEAIRQGTPIVVMWRIPERRVVEFSPPRYFVSIVEWNQQAGGPLRIDPIWIEQTPPKFFPLPQGRRVEDVGAVAAFPLDAFVPGRRVVISAKLPPTGDGQSSSVERWGWIDWKPSLNQQR